MTRLPFDEHDAAPTDTVGHAGAAVAPAQGVRVTVLAGPDEGKTAAIAQRTAIIGRGAAADFQLSDPTVSALHVEVSSSEHGVEVSDLASRNGTLHARARLGRAVVPSGSTLEIGSTLVRVELDVALEPPPPSAVLFGELRGASDAMRALIVTLERLAPTDLSVLIEGPTGTGKELAARAVHAKSRCAEGPFVVLDCTAIPSTLAESVLFGHERGAFTGAAERRAGIFEASDGGTLLLDEVGELALELQPKLLRVLERREVVRVGGSKPLPVRVRVLAATWRDLRRMTNRGLFREDLYYRLAQTRVVIPPLRDRSEDIPVLVRHFLASLPADHPGARDIAADALAELEHREYAGNVRELKSAVERAAVLAAGPAITAADLAFERVLMGEQRRPPRPTTPPPPTPEGAATMGTFRDEKRSVLDEFELSYLSRLLARTSGNVTRAAAIAGIERHYLRSLLRKHGLRTTDAK